MRFLKRLLPFAFLLAATSLSAQKGTGPIDFVVAVIGDEIVLNSDIDAQYEYFTSSGQKDDGTLRCQLVERAIVELLLLNKARQDSLTVSADQVDNELEQRIQDILSAYGSIENIEKVYRKSYVEIKAELRPEIEKQMLTQQMRNKILGDAAVTPREVRKFFNDIPKDSLPYMPAEVEVNQIVIFPKFSDAALEDAFKVMREMRNEIVTGKATFEDMARKYSDDLAAAKEGGSLGEFRRGVMVPEFDEVVFNMAPGEISQPFKSRFGIHIVKLEKRVGELVTAKHILKKPSHTSNDDTLAVRELIRIRKAVLSDSITFEKAASQWSEDPQSKNCGGCVKNPQTGELRIPLDALPADLYFKVDKLKPGEISKPVSIMQQNGEKAYHLIMLRSKIPAHQANLEADYQRIQEAALQNKQLEVFEKWLESARKNVYIEIKDDECLKVLNNWIQ